MSIRRKVASTVAAGIVALGGGIVAAAPAHATTFCPSGYACIYNGTTVDSHIKNMWRNAGTYKLWGYEGRHLVVNNQTDNWLIWLCESWDGTGGTAVWPGSPVVYNMTPINSVAIQPS